MSRWSVLIVEDEPIIAMEMMELVEERGHFVCGWATNARAAVALALDTKPKVILMDVRLAGEQDGIQTAHEIAAGLETSIIFCTAQTDDATRIRIDECRPVAVLHKPVQQERLDAAFAGCGLEAG